MQFENREVDERSQQHHRTAAAVVCSMHRGRRSVRAGQEHIGAPVRHSHGSASRTTRWRDRRRGNRSPQTRSSCAREYRDNRQNLLNSHTNAPTGSDTHRTSPCPRISVPSRDRRGPASYDAEFVAFGVGHDHVVEYAVWFVVAVDRGAGGDEAVDDVLDPASA
jgi:hypothetical protein